MIRFVADQNFDWRIVEGLVRKEPTIDMPHVYDLGLSEATDQEILEWAAINGRIVLTHDRKTMPPFAFARIAAALPMPGVFVVSKDMPIGEAIDEILLAAECYSPQELENTVRYFPM